MKYNIYFDCASTVKPYPEVLKVFSDISMNDFANAGLESYANSIIVDYINIRIDDLQKTDIFKLSQGYQIVNNRY